VCSHFDLLLAIPAKRAPGRSDLSSVLDYPQRLPFHLLFEHRWSV